MALHAGFDEEERGNVTIAVREAVLNAILHGNEYSPEKQIFVCLENTGRELIITIADQGPGLDPKNLPDPLAPENLLHGCGRGIFLMRNFMDEVFFRDLHPGTEVTLIRRLPLLSGAKDA